MAKNFKISSKSDMRKFGKQLESDVKKLAKDSLSSQLFDVTCPHCEASVSVPEGRSNCPQCGEPIKLNLDFQF
ncbi:hypothetical protein WOSG25_021980 [Weissella oryzae SG25]|uniref:Uncharacterized protein n=1 Tax=Weissella oryzae (strain DSM 25784 / JCM 18191 / LMG 30913 / SG25) TaxID=1329250 RepID=A0A069CZA7_WEIOS|nr:hypothetical protein [Weissella oryzae]GAK30401.1 hypothetical protein WOSG25_021980 [Weissella oryzae SG25]